MKKSIHIILCIVLSLSCLGLNACQKVPPIHEMTGGHTYQAADPEQLHVEDTKLQALYFYIDDAERCGGSFVVKIPELEDDTAEPQLSFEYYDYRDEAQNLNEQLTIDDDTLETLGKAISKTDILSVNGLNDFTVAIPPSTGTFVLRATFESGEKLDVAINGGFSDGFYEDSLEWMKAIWSILDEARIDGEHYQNLYKAQENE